MASNFFRISYPVPFVVLLLSIMPVMWGFIAYDLQRLWVITDANYRQQAESLAHVFSEQVNSSMNAIDYALIELREKWEEDAAGFSGVVRRRQQYLETNVGFQVAVLDAQGVLLFSSADPGAKGSVFSDREHFLVHSLAQRDNLFISKPLLGRVSKRWTIQFTRPILDENGSFRGVIVLSVAPEHFSSLSRTIKLGEDTEILVVRQAGELLARSPATGAAFGAPVDRRMLPDLGSRSSGLFEGSLGMDDIDRLYAWRRTANGSLLVFVGLSKEALFASYRKQRNVYLGSGAVLSALWLMAAAFLLSAYRRRQQQEQALRESHDRLSAEQQRMRIIIENSHDAFIAVDPQERITDWNTKAERMFGWTRSEVLGKEMGTLIVPEELRAAHRAGFARFAASGQTSAFSSVVELEALNRNSERIPVEMAVAGCLHGQQYAVSAFIRDISQRKAAQRQEVERSRSLEEARRALQHAQKLEAVGKLTGGVAHDFNNVLQIIAGNLQLLQSLINDNESLQRRIASALDAVDRGAKLSSQLLSFARRQSLKPVIIDLRTIIAGMADLLQRAVGENVRISTRWPEAAWNACLDPSQLENVILNLVLNARDAMQGQGSIVIGIDNVSLPAGDPASPAGMARGDYVLLVVSDTGSGMTADVRERAFEPFFSTKPAGEGTGLGLSMAYGFVKQSGGHIELHSEAGRGTDVRIWLPRSLQEAVPLESRCTEPACASGTEAILVAEDDAHVRAAAVALLKELGYQVYQASDGEEAVRLLQTLPGIDLLFADVIMPGRIRGIELAKRAREAVPDIAVLFTSGYTENALGEAGVLGADIHLLAKPYRREQLAAAIRSLLHQKITE